MDIIKGQGILIQWFRHNSQNTQSLTKIRLVCKNIRNQLGDFDNTNYLYHFLFPLLRIGLVEFVGKGKYRLSPPSLIEKKGKLISVNLNDNQIQKLTETIEHFQFHRSIVFHKKKYAKQIEATTGLKIIKPDIRRLLTQIPKIKDVIDQFDHANVFETQKFMFHNNNFRWSKNYSKNLLGCFRASENVAARRYLRVDIDAWKKIPDRETNPDIFNWAYCYGHILNGFPLGIEYDENLKILKVRNIYFPIILERLLRLNNLNNVIRTQNENIFKDINTSIFTTLNNIFLNNLK